MAGIKAEPKAVRGPMVDELAALDGIGKSGTWAVFGRELAVTNPDKVLFSQRPGEAPVTKRELLRYAAPCDPTGSPSEPSANGSPVVAIRSRRCSDMISRCRP